MYSDIINIQSARIPCMGFGTYRLTGSEGMKSIEEALCVGYRHIDTAQVYENEEEVGRAVQQSGIIREEIFITTKIWPSDFDKLIPKTEESLRKLKTDYVDLLLLHWPANDESDRKAVDLLLKTLQKGYCKYVGLSNFSIEQTREARKQAPIICNQVEYHPYLSQIDMLTYLKENKMFLTAYCPIARGDVAREPVIKELGYKYDKTAGQISLRWLIQQENVAAIPKSSSTKRIKENLNVFDFELSKEDMQTLFKLNRGKRYC